MKSLAERLHDAAWGDCSLNRPWIVAIDAMFTELRAEFREEFREEMNALEGEGFTRGDAPSHARDASSPSEIVALPCIVCRRELKGCATPNQPLDGLAFQSRGAYGTTVFDPMDGSYLEINVCDECLTSARRAWRVFLYPSSPRGARPAPTNWERADDGEGRGPASSERLSASQDEVKPSPPKTSEPEVTITTEMVGAGITEWRKDRATGVMARPIVYAIYSAMRALEPKRPVEITGAALDRAYNAFAKTYSKGNSHLAVRAALRAALFDPQETSDEAGETWP